MRESLSLLEESASCHGLSGGRTLQLQQDLALRDGDDPAGSDRIGEAQELDGCMIPCL